MPRRHFCESLSMRWLATLFIPSDETSADGERVFFEIFAQDPAAGPPV